MGIKASHDFPLPKHSIRCYFGIKQARSRKLTVKVEHSQIAIKFLKTNRSGGALGQKLFMKSQHHGAFFLQNFGSKHFAQRVVSAGVPRANNLRLKLKRRRPSSSSSSTFVGSASRIACISVALLNDSNSPMKVPAGFVKYLSPEHDAFHKHKTSSNARGIPWRDNTNVKTSARASGSAPDRIATAKPRIDTTSGSLTRSAVSRKKRSASSGS